MKKIILIALLFVFIGDVTTVAKVVEQCSLIPVSCSDGFLPCYKIIYKSDDNGITIDKEEKAGCCKVGCGCDNISQQESPDGKICCEKKDNFIVEGLEECQEPEDYEYDLKRCVVRYGCCSTGLSYISRYESCKGEGCEKIQGCCAKYQQVVEAMACQGCGNQSLPIGGCCDQAEEVYVSGYGDCGEIHACCSLEEKAYPISCEDPAKGGCCPKDTEHFCANGKDICCAKNKVVTKNGEKICCSDGEEKAKNDNGEDICCPKDKIKDGKCEGCGAGETPYTNNDGKSACCAGAVYNCNDEDGDGVTTCECCPKCTGKDDNGKWVPAGCGEVKDE